METKHMAQTTSMSGEDIYEIGVEAYTYLYPLVTMDITRRQMTGIEPGKRPGFGPMNTFSHVNAFPPADFKIVVRPNFDTLYSSAWLDMTGEPMIVSVPDTGGRYYLLEMLDMWTDAFAAPGKRTTGTRAHHFAVVPPGWSGELPTGVTRIDAPTPYVWIIGRTQTNGPGDYEAVRQVQSGYKVIPLSQWGGALQPVTAEIDPTLDMLTPPLEQVNSMPASAYFTYAAELMKLHPPHLTDWSMLAQMKQIGLEPGKSFDFEHLDPAVKQVLERATSDGLKLMHAKVPTLAPIINGWLMSTNTMGVYGVVYLKRAIVTLIGLGANQPRDAIYPIATTDADGKPINGNNDYVLHFDKEELPPVNAFWSLTMYDEDGFQADNPIHRFAIGDRDVLRYNTDGSLDIYIQHDHPGPDRESNWLPAPRGPLGLTLRLYAPKMPGLNGRWLPPAVKRFR